MRGRIVLAAAAVAVSAVAAAHPALGHATFPVAVNPTGSAANPRPGNSAEYFVARVPEERPGPPKQDNVDVKVELPAGWSDPVCQDALTAAGANPGPAAAGWSCAVEQGNPTVIHWTRAAAAASIGIYFPFFATTGEAGTVPVTIHQTYANGEVVRWKDVPVPPGCTTGTNQAGTACTWPAPQIVVGAPAPRGYWLAASDGGVFAFGAAVFHGSTGALVLNRPVVGMAPTPSGKGYWLVASDGGVFAFGDAVFLGSTGATKLNQPVVGMAPTPSGKGYWLVASDGGVFAFGDAAFLGSTGATKLNQPVVGMVPAPSGRGYALVAGDGGVFSFGNARFLGAGAGASGFVGGALTPSGTGYWLATAGGQVQRFGDAPALGSTGALNRPVVAIAAL